VFAAALAETRRDAPCFANYPIYAPVPFSFARIIETPKSGDQGADVLIEKAGERTVIQAKLYSDSVGNKAVQEAIAARSHFRCHAAKVVTNSYFTPSAQQLAESSDVQLIGREELSQMIDEFNRNAKDYSRLATLIQAATSTTAAAGGGA